MVVYGRRHQPVTFTFCRWTARWVVIVVANTTGGHRYIEYLVTEYCRQMSITVIRQRPANYRLSYCRAERMAFGYMSRTL